MRAETQFDTTDVIRWALTNGPWCPGIAACTTEPTTVEPQLSEFRWGTRIVYGDERDDDDGGGGYDDHHGV